MVLLLSSVVSYQAVWVFVFFFFQAEDGIRDLVRSRGLGDVYKRQARHLLAAAVHHHDLVSGFRALDDLAHQTSTGVRLSLIHI